MNEVIHQTTEDNLNSNDASNISAKSGATSDGSNSFNLDFPLPTPESPNNKKFQDVIDILSQSSSQPIMFQQLNLNKGKAPISAPSDAEQRFHEKMQKARETYLKMVEDALKELESPPKIQVQAPPVFETMTDEQMEEELSRFGFRFTTRQAAISKLARCWAAKANQEKAIPAETNPLDFIRNRSKFYEQILVYQPVPLGELYREMVDSGVDIPVSRLKAILDEEGVAFLDEKNRMRKGHN
ncbi:hypothetical protein GPJ56_008053 [Histomonas meleagridis]|uniref:uncharacterized protein n=1 Tax=Histomonas meleagridis TaxID=135588 RepID=UPI00355A4535|nr:hypothetical protein GPJ56_008053 [Histomonas meleagridis]KAH0800317.1 hypothetical protein GO595_006906 [Histomonas meleagridis]